MNRKIMVEVTPQELEKIQAGKLNTEDMTIEQLVHQLVKKLDADDGIICQHSTDMISFRRTEDYDCKINDNEYFRLVITRSIL